MFNNSIGSCLETIINITRKHEIFFEFILNFIVFDIFFEFYFWMYIKIQFLITKYKIHAQRSVNNKSQKELIIT